MTTPFNATEDELRAATEVLKLASLLDDRVAAADKARIVAWAEQIHRHRLERGDLLDGLQLFYDSPSLHSIGIGDLIHHARNVKRARLEREADAERDKRREQVDAKAADMVAGIAGMMAAAAGPVTDKTPRLDAAETALHCATSKDECRAAIAEYLAAKAEAATKPVNA